MTPWAVAHQTPLSMEFSRQEYWSGLPFPFPGDLLDPGIKSGSPALQKNSLLSEPPKKSHSSLMYIPPESYFLVRRQITAFRGVAFLNIYFCEVLL